MANFMNLKRFVNMDTYELEALLSESKPVVAKIRESDTFMKRATLAMLSEGLEEMRELKTEEVLEIVTEVDACGTSDIKYQPFIECLASVGIKSLEYETAGQFFPHNRDFIFLPQCREFTYNGYIVDKWEVPELGAEKYPRSKVGSVSVISEAGIIGNKRTSTLVFGGREKLDGFEVIVFTITTSQGTFSFKWDESTIEIVASRAAHYEKVDGKLYFLSGDVYNREPGSILHPWFRLNTALVEECLGKEGMILMIDGKSYRLPNRLTCTLMCDGGWAYDKTRTIRFAIDKDYEGLFDFYNYRNDYECSESWVIGKARPDKVRPDSIGGIKEMYHSAVTLPEFVDKVIIPNSKELVQVPDTIRVIPYIENIAPSISHVIGYVMPIRIADLANVDSYRRNLLCECGNNIISTYSMPVVRPNMIFGSGRVYTIPRHSRDMIFKFGGDVFSTSPDCCGMQLFIFHLSDQVPGSFR